MQILFRIFLVLAATVFMVSVIVAGAVLTLGYALWCLLRGQPVRWPHVFMGPLCHMKRQQPWSTSGPRGFRPSRADGSAVIEGQARELR